jgi:hypothetical protein
MIECGDTIGGYHQQQIAYRVEIANLAPRVQIKIFELGSNQCGQLYASGEE